MKPLSALSFLNWTLLAKPACDRALYKLIKTTKARSILEIGLADGVRAERMIRVAQKFGAGKTVKYTGIDLFDGRDSDAPTLRLIDVHKRISALGVKPQLVPGDLAMAIRRVANSHTRTDLVVVSAGFDTDALDASWFFVPRMLHSGSSFMIQNQADGQFKNLSRLEIERRAEQTTVQKVAA